MKGLQPGSLHTMAGARKRGPQPTPTAALLTCMIATVISHFPPHILHDCADFQTSGIFQDNRLQVQFLLFTPRNPTCAKLLQGNRTDIMESSAFNATLDTKVIIHGFRALGTKPSWIDDMVASLLAAGEVNVVAVDWVYGATAKYNQAVENIPRLSMEVVALLSGFLDLGCRAESFHLIGVSLGAHVSGYVGNYFGGRIGKITGLDPAAYKFTRSGPEERLDPGDAMFVEAVHTDTDNFGIRIPVGHVDYYINGGRDQPGCPSLRNPYGYLICDHMRSVSVFINALRRICSYVGFPCSSYQMFREGQCTDCQTSPLSSCPHIGMKSLQVTPDVVHSTASPGPERIIRAEPVTRAEPVSIAKSTTRAEGVIRAEPVTRVEGVTRAEGVTTSEVSHISVPLFVLTTAAEPYCAHHILVEFTLTETKDNVITLEVQLISADTGTSKAKVTISKHNLEGRGLAAHGTPLCRVDMVVLKTSSSWMSLRRRKDFSGTLCLAELPLSNRQEMKCLPDVLTFSGSDHQTHNLAQSRSPRCR